MAEYVGQGVLRVVPSTRLEAAIRAADQEKAAAQDAAQQPVMSNLASYIRMQFDMMKRHRNQPNAGWTDRLLRAQRVFNGVYEPTQLAEIRKFGGSEVYARIIAMKCRGAASLLRDVYLAPDRPWGLDPTSDPEIPPEIMASISQLVQSEIGQMQQAGVPVDPGIIRDRTSQLVQAAREAAKNKAEKRAELAEDKIDEILVEGGFYKALSEFINDVPMFPFGVIKGPFVKIVPTVTWKNGQALVQQKPRLMWKRVSPFDVWWTPGAADIEDAAVIERDRVTRADLNDLLDLPGYNTDAIRGVLRDYGAGGLHEDWDASDAERAVNENRENPMINQSGMITCLEFHGNVQGQMLLDWGMDDKQVPDALRDYFVQAWLIGPYVIKVQMSPSPRKRHPFFVTSFEKVPGTPVGNGLPDILNDIQDVCNASLRALVNNMSISSGPQAVINDDRLAPDEDGEEMYPWKRWHVQSDPMGNNAAPPISFFQPNSNSQELLGVFQKFNEIADDISAIPRYLAGSSAGGAGRTASGLAMLLGNASKVLQTVAANIDRDVLDPLLRQLLDMILLTDTTGMLEGDETVKVMGVSVAVQKETQRSRQLEFLQITANPIDSQIIGIKGRAAILREVSHNLGMPGADIVPSDDELQKEQQAAQQAQAAQMGAIAQGNQAPKGGNVNNSPGPRTSIAGGPQ
jgi:hypothetical protein